MPMNYRELIQDTMGPLLADGWAVERICEFPDNGCTEIVVSIGEISARFVSHCGRFSIDVGVLRAVGGWYNWNDILGAAGETVPCEPLTCLKQAVALLVGAAQKVDTYLKDPVLLSRLGARGTAPSGDRTRS
jgi:hypothetical protein